METCLLCDFKAASKSQVFVHMWSQHRTQVLELFSGDNLEFQESKLVKIEDSFFEAHKFFDDQCSVIKPSFVDLSAIYKCDSNANCNYQTADLIKFAEHQRFASQQEYQCHLCDCKRCSQYSLDLHILKKHSVEKSESEPDIATQRKSYHCYLCDQDDFFSLSNVKRHFFMAHADQELDESKFIITDNGKIPCRKCQVSFSSKTERKHHFCIALFQQQQKPETSNNQHLISGT